MDFEIIIDDFVFDDEFEVQQLSLFPDYEYPEVIPSDIVIPSSSLTEDDRQFIEQIKNVLDFIRTNLDNEWITDNPNKTLGWFVDWVNETQLNIKSYKIEKDVINNMKMQEAEYLIWQHS
jgi:hypothetical protein